MNEDVIIRKTIENKTNIRSLETILDELLVSIDPEKKISNGGG